MHFNNLVSFWILCALSQTCAAKGDLLIWYNLIFLSINIKAKPGKVI